MASAHPEELRVQLLDLVAHYYWHLDLHEDRNHPIMVVPCELYGFLLFNQPPMEVLIGGFELAIVILVCFGEFGQFLAVELGNILKNYTDIAGVELTCELLVVGFILEDYSFAEVVDGRRIEYFSTLLK